MSIEVLHTGENLDAAAATSYETYSHAHGKGANWEALGEEKKDAWRAVAKLWLDATRDGVRGLIEELRRADKP